MGFERYYEAREKLEDFLRKDLLGPVSEDEVIRDTWPTDYYIAGRLFPQGTNVGQEEQEKDELEDETDSSDQSVSMCYSAFPSSMAISFSVKPGTKKLKILTGFAWYTPVEKSTEESRYKNDYDWHRNSKSESFEIDIDPPFEPIPLNNGLVLRIFLQKTYSDGSKTLTVAMVNTNKNPIDMIGRNAMTYFQPYIIVRGTTEGEPVFVEKKLRVSLNKDKEVRTLEMLYRHNRTFASGHGCSTGWKTQGEIASEVYTEFLPTYEMLQMMPAMYIKKDILTFRFLGEKSLAEVVSGLGQLLESYKEWIRVTRDKISEIPDYADVAEDNLNFCNETYDRISNGIKLLQKDKDVFQTFQLVNRAMLRQRMQQKKGTDIDSHSWYPFQLAFILQEISSIANPENKYRDVVDLLWFPTGGGKTEAYLGLAAFAFFLRRIRGVKQNTRAGGVTVMMRYTLRLLTLQQFERASSLICACELIRKENPGLLGNEEIAAGLWVGSEFTPNSREKGLKSLKIILEDGFDALGEDDPNPCQVLRCPWCGTDIKPQHYNITEEKMVISCPNEKCDFHNGLPVYVIDEDIYDHGPALVVGTIDKYARMTWEKKIGSLFGIGTDWMPPELIIQDELHLISGPLGTIAGLYEVAVDELCKHNGTRAKVIASTATIRNAKNQILNLYGRDFRQFPPQGIDIRDSYFAVESTRDDRPARRYLGVMVPGTSGNTAMIRVYSVLLFGARYLAAHGYPKEVIDSFWTVTGYFNSLKQLGGALVNVIDDVHGRLKYLYGTKFHGELPEGETPPELLYPDELTSRKKNSEIAETLKQLEVKYPSPAAYDVVLASNMLSVGIDIGRLGLMVLRGQPKSNSEYIQATSRVGRQTPGFVLTLHDSSRSRDRSHYEQFLAYHSSIYRYVEATSLTPFAERARDRALHAVLVSLCRHLIRSLQGNNDAGRIVHYMDDAEEMAARILERVQLIDEVEYESCREQLMDILDWWEQLASSDLVYQKFSGYKGASLLTDKFDHPGNSIATLNSMRNVDVESDITLEV